MQILVLGMHRSGTSTLARILNLLGCYFGNENMMTPTAPDNPKGFWERKDVMVVNDLILGSAGGSWWDVDGLDFQNISSSNLDLIHQGIRDVIIKLDSHRPWFIKDPRLCLTLDFWLPNLENTVFLLALRSPLAIAKSLQQRNAIPISYSLALWEYYMRSMLNSLKTARYIPITYESIIQRPFETAVDLHASLVNSGVSGLHQPERKAIEAFVDPALRHFIDDFDPTQEQLPQHHLLEALIAEHPIQADPIRVETLSDQLGQLKIDDTWALSIPKVLSLEASMRRLEELEETKYILETTIHELEGKNEVLEANNHGLEEDNSRLKAENCSLEDNIRVLNSANHELASKANDLEIKNNNLQFKNNDLQFKNNDLQSKNNEIEFKCDQFKNRLQAISHSRLLRTIAMLTRFGGLGRSGINAELVRIDTLLNPLIVNKKKRLVTKNNVSLLMRIFHLFLINPIRTIQLLDRSRVKKTLSFLFESKGNLALFLKRCQDVHFRTNSNPVGAIPESAITLIQRYGLPLSSEDERPILPSKTEINKWTKHLGQFELKKFNPETIPVVSIIIPVHNQIRFTLACLHSIYLNIAETDYEIIIADDHSSDQTANVFGKAFPRVRYQRNSKNLGFLRNCNNAAKSARGRYLVFLNNDTVVLPGWLEELVNTFKLDSTIGLVGSKLIYPEGALQEAGGIVFEDGSGWNFGHFCDPAEPVYNHMRDVDYCSGASLAIPTKLWRELDGFDESFAPAYYEDTDLAFKVRAVNKRVVYQPCSELVHFEGVSNGSSTHSGIKRFQAINHPKFRKKWKDVLISHGICDPEALPYLRGIKGRILFIDATTPRPDMDSGSIDAFNYMIILKDFGFHITFATVDVTYFEGYSSALQRMGVECVHLPWIESPHEAIEKYAPDADIVILCRVKVAEPLIDSVRRHAPNARILFDTVDLHFLREAREAELYNSSVLKEKATKTRDIELDVIKKSDATILRSDYEIEVIKNIVPESKLFKIPVVRELPQPTRTSWDKLEDIVFIGGFGHPPNIDAVEHFLNDVWPILKKNGFPGKFIIAGSNMPDEIKGLASDDIVVRGYVADLSRLFGACRLSVAPLRYGAGMKGKVITSLSYGIPCVATEMAVEGAGLIHGENIMVSKNAEEMAQMIKSLYFDRKRWHEISAAGLDYCQKVISMEAVKKKFEDVITQLLGWEMK